MNDPDPMPLSYSGPAVGSDLPRPAVTPRGPAAAAVSLIAWTVGTVVIIGLPVASGILATLGPGSGFTALVVLVVLLPLLAVAARGTWDRFRERLVRSTGRRPRSPAGELLAIALDRAAWTFVAVLYVGAPLLVLLWASGAALAFPALIVLLLATLALAAAGRAVRRRRAFAVLGYLEQAVRLNQPLDRMVAAAAAGEGGLTRRRLEDLYLALHGGMSTVDAVHVAVPEVSPRALGVIAYGESSGRLPTALRRLIAERLSTGRPTEGDRTFAAWYPPVMLLVLVLVMGSVGTFVLPKFQRIFHDFGIPLRPFTAWLFAPFDSGTGQWGGWGLWLIPVAAIAVAAMLGRQLRYVAHGDRQSWVLQGLWDRANWYLPGLRQLHRDGNLADLCDALADAVEQGFPLNAAVTRAQRLGLNTVLLRRVSAWAGGLDQGIEPSTAARAAALPPLIAGLLATDPTGAAAGLRFAARFYAGRHAARRAVLAAAYVPVVTLAMGALVAAVGLALILPIRDLIDRLEPFKVGL